MNAPTSEKKTRKYVRTTERLVGCCSPPPPRQETESLLFQKGQAQSRLQELTSLCERQRSKLAEATLRARELESVASAAKEDTRLAEAQVRKDECRSWTGWVDCWVVFFPASRQPSYMREVLHTTAEL